MTFRKLFQGRLELFQKKKSTENCLIFNFVTPTHIRKHANGGISHSQSRVCTNHPARQTNRQIDLPSFLPFRSFRLAPLLVMAKISHQKNTPHNNDDDERLLQ